MILLTAKIIKSLLKPRKESSHKGDYGHALLVVGNKYSMGAAHISAKACLRAGTGLLTVNIPESERCILQTSIPEAMIMKRETTIANFSKFSGIGIGSGFGMEEEEENLLVDLLTNYLSPIVIDADAITILSKQNTWISKIPKNSILTPHEKEFDRIFGLHANREDRIKTAIIKAKELQVIIVLKGHQTIIVSEHESYINSTGNSGLAKGGSGDALTGIITGFLAQNYSPLNAAILGVYLHGKAADLTLNKQSEESMLITDVIESMGEVFKLMVE